MPSIYIYPKGHQRQSNFEEEDLPSKEENRQILSGATKGVGIGASVGSAIPVPGVGTAVGSVVGGVVGTVTGWFSDEPRIGLMHVLQDLIKQQFGDKAFEGANGTIIRKGEYPPDKILELVKNICTNLARKSGDTFDMSEARKFNRNLVVSKTKPNLKTRKEEDIKFGGSEYIVKFDKVVKTNEVAANAKSNAGMQGNVKTVALIGVAAAAGVYLSQ